MAAVTAHGKTLRRFLVEELGDSVEKTLDRTKETSSSVPDTVENIVLKVKRGITERTLRALLQKYFGAPDSQVTVRPGFVFISGKPNYMAAIQYSGIFEGGSISINLTEHS